MSARTQIQPIDAKFMVLVTATSAPAALTTLLAAAGVSEIADNVDLVLLQPHGSSLLKWHLADSAPDEAVMAGAIEQYRVWPLSFPAEQLRKIYLYSASNNAVGVIGARKIPGPV